MFVPAFNVGGTTLRNAIILDYINPAILVHWFRTCHGCILHALENKATSLVKCKSPEHFLASAGGKLLHILGLGAASWRGLLGEILEDLRETAGGALGGRRSLNLLTPAADKSLDQKSDGCYHTRGPTHRLQPHETGPGGGGVYCTVQLYCGPVQHWAGHAGEGGRG